MLFRSLTIVGIATADYGVTQNFVRALDRVLPQTRDVGNMNVTASLNARWVLSRQLSAFARYTFLFQHVEEPVTMQDIGRHLLLAGVTLSLTAGEADYLDGVVPFQEAEIMHAIRGATAAAPGAEAVAAEQSAAGEDEGVLDDPLDPTERPIAPPPRSPGEPEPRVEPYPPGDPRRQAPTPPAPAAPAAPNPSPTTPPRERTEGLPG